MLATRMRQAAAGSDSFDPEAAALFAAMSPAPSSARKALINAWFVGIKADFGVASIALIFDIFYMLAAHSAQAAGLNWVNPATFALQPVDSPAFTVDRGGQGNGSSSYYNTGWNPSVNGTRYTLNSASLGVYCRTNTNAGIDAALFNNSSLVARLSGSASGRNNTTLGSVASVTATSEGMTSISRTGAALSELYRNGVSIASNTNASTAVPNLELYLMARNDGLGAPGFFTTRQTSVFYVAKGMSSTENAAVFNRTEAYLDAIGAGVIT